MYSEKITITNETGLHARPASNFVKEASKYKSHVSVACGEREANAKSIMSVLALGASQGSEITITADGPDQKEAVTNLIELVRNAE